MARARSAGALPARPRCLSLTPAAAFHRHDLSAQLMMGCKDAVTSDLIHARGGDERGQAGDEIQRLEDHVGRPIRTHDSADLCRCVVCGRSSLPADYAAS
jgi:hypothetical protein